MPRKAIHEEQLEKIKRMTEEGYTQKDIGDLLGVTKSTIGYYQKKLDLKASNKWHFGETASKKPVNLEVKKPKKQYTIVAEKTVKLTGKATKFEYSFGTNSKAVSINPGYSEKIEIDLKDLLNFSNELIDVAETLEKMRSEKD